MTYIATKVGKHIGMAIAIPALIISLLLVNTAHAQSTTTPGTPSTGSGGAATTNGIILVASGLAALAGIAYLVRKPREEA